ncbi:pyridoxal phosphate-dependent aminotransferase [bacterium]|nr:pyridoxal phosphate-dependent aminotransferase [bacterium]
MKLSKRIASISPSATLAITSKAKKMKQEGIDVIGFGAGEPDFDTPSHIKDAAIKALGSGLTKYTPTSGIKELKEAICRKFKVDNNLDYSPENVLVSCGAKHSLYNAILTLCEENDEVILPSPYWVSYIEMIKASGANPVIVKTDKESSFRMTPKQLSGAITPRTKLFILNSPSNPTGMAYTEDDLISISGILTKRNIFCISDEIYEKLIYDGERHISIASLGEKIKDITIVINGMSKAYSMTGWRIGYAAGPREVIQGMSNLQDHSTSNPTSFAQYASVEALTGSQNELKEMVAEFKKRRDFMVERVNAIKGLSTVRPQGAFYCFVDIEPVLNKSINGMAVKDSFSFTEALLMNAHVAVVPGGAFGDSRYIRLSYAVSMEDIKRGLERIESFVKRLV